MNFQTPEWICNLMVSLIPPHCRTILEPTPGKGNLVRALKKQKGFIITAPKDFWKLTNSYRVQCYDAIVMNPPFSPASVGYRFLFKCMALSDNIVALVPWWCLINSQERSQRIFEFGLVEVYHLPRSAFPGARIQTCIIKLQKGYLGIPRLHLTDHWPD